MAALTLSQEDMYKLYLFCFIVLDFEGAGTSTGGNDSK